MESSFLLVPLPRINVVMPNLEAEFNTHFLKKGGSFPHYVYRMFLQLGTNLNAYRFYIPELYSIRGTSKNVPFSTIFSNPFIAKEVKISSIEIDVEIVNEIWNFIASLMQYLMTLNSSDVESLKTMKIVMEDLLISSQNLCEIIVDVKHPFISNATARFVKSYIRYLVDYWKLNIIQLQKENLTPKPAMRCLDDIRICEEMIKLFPPEDIGIKSFFSPIIFTLKKYLSCYVRYQIGKNFEAALEIGQAIAFFQSGYEISQQSIENADITFAPHLGFACKIVRNNIITELNTTRKNNKAVYYQAVPDHIELPPPSQPADLQPGRSLFELPQQQQQQQTSPSTPISDTPIINEQAPSISNNKTENSYFPEWNEIVGLKIELKKRLDQLGTKYPKVCSELKANFSVADKNDSIIQNAVNQFNPTQNGIKAQIDQMIDPAKKFYFSLKNRLDTLESTGI